MSANLACGQYEDAYRARRLGNWEVVPPSKAPRRSKAPAPTRGAATTFIADARGHLLPGVPKVSNAFEPTLRPGEASPPRWPSATVTLRAAAAATIGAKGPLWGY